MRIAVAFILLISLAVAFKLEKEHPMFEDDPDERYGPAEQDEPFELDELDEPTERIEQENYEDGNEVIDQLTLHVLSNKHALAKLPNYWFNKFLQFGLTLHVIDKTCYFLLSSSERSKNPSVCCLTRSY